MAACSKVSERGESAGATPTTASGATVERATARLVQQVRLMIAFFFFFLYCWLQLQECKDAPTGRRR